MNRLWEKYLPQIEERVTTLQQAAESLAHGALSQGGQQKAAAAAHKLAGVLGTFGLNEGTELAREAESLYELSPEAIAPLATQLSGIANRLQEMISGRS